jgi:nitroreductase
MVLHDTALTECVQAAIAAPSIYNSQPWRFRIRDGGIDVFVDWSRQLQVIDASGRELILSVGAALYNLRLAMRVHGHTPVLRPWPDPDDPDLAARVVPGPPAPPDAAASALAAAIPARHTNRRPFAREALPAMVIAPLVAAARTEGATLHVAAPVERSAILSLVRTARERLRAQGIYRAEMPRVTRVRRGGLVPQAFGPWDAMEALPMRDIGLNLPQLERSDEHADPLATFAVLSTDADTAEDWLQGGQALEKVLLLATLHGVAATPMSQPLEVPSLRELFIGGGSGRWPQVLLRLGYAQPTTPSPRRPLGEVLDVDPTSGRESG